MNVTIELHEDSRGIQVDCIPRTSWFLGLAHSVLQAAASVNARVFPPNSDNELNVEEVHPDGEVNDIIGIANS